MPRPRPLWLVVLLPVALLAAWGVTRPGERPRTEIFRGVFHTCERLPDTDRSGGLAHIVEIDLTAPGIELFTTPTDGFALEEGWQYHLKLVGAAARQARLSVAVNGTLFSSFRTIPLPGDGANAVETVVSAHEVNHVWEHAYLAWFDEDLTPHLEYDKPPPAAALEKARWAISGQGVALRGGAVRGLGEGQPDRRTMLGMDTARRRLWLAVFEHASISAAAEALARHGARDAIALDGGDSTSMVIGPRAATGPRGAVLTGYRPVATILGVRADPLSP